MIASGKLRWRPVRLPIDPVERDDGLGWARCFRWLAVLYTMGGLVVWWWLM